VYEFDRFGGGSVMVWAGIYVSQIQRGNQNPYIEEEQTTQWPKGKSAKGQTTIYKTYI
jgi:hypothetical protein